MKKGRRERKTTRWVARIKARITCYSMASESNEYKLALYDRGGRILISHGQNINTRTRWKSKGSHGSITGNGSREDSPSTSIVDPRRLNQRSECLWFLLLASYRLAISLVVSHTHPKCLMVGNVFRGMKLASCKDDK